MRVRNFPARLLPAAAVMILILTACGGDDATPAGIETEQSTSTTPPGTLPATAGVVSGTSILRAPPDGDVHARQQLDVREERRLERLWQQWTGLENAVHSKTHLHSLRH